MSEQVTFEEFAKTVKEAIVEDLANRWNKDWRSWYADHEDIEPDVTVYWTKKDGYDIHRTYYLPSGLWSAATFEQDLISEMMKTLEEDIYASYVESGLLESIEPSAYDL